MPSRDVPPFGPGCKPASGPLGRLRDRVLRPILIGSMGKVFLPSVNAACAAVGAAPFTSVGEMFTVAPLLLYMTAEPFEYPRSDWPACVRMVGPSCWDPPAEPPAWLAEIERPIVLVSTSSEFQDDGRLVTIALEALADEDVHVVATGSVGRAPAHRCARAGRPEAMAVELDAETKAAKRARDPLGHATRQAPERIADVDDVDAVKRLIDPTRRRRPRQR